MTRTAVRWREVSIAASLFAFASVVLTLPLALHPTRTLPSDLVDTLLTTWVISWDADRLRHGLDGVWNAPIYYPYLRTLAFSENLFGIAFLVAPVYWISGNPVLTYNIAFLLAFTLAGTGMYVLVRELTNSAAAATVAAAYYAFCPYRMAQAQLSHIQMLSTGWLPLALWAVHRYFDSYRRKWLALLVGACCLQALSNIYLAYFMAVPMAVVLAFHATRSRDRIRQWSIDLVVAAAVTAAVLAPIAVQYYRVQVEQQHVRSAGEIEVGGADLRAYFVGVTGLWRRWLPLPQGVFGESEKELFPGLVAPLLAALAGGLLLRRRGSPPWPLAYALIAIAGFLLSLGPLVRIWGVVLTHHGPYDWLQRVIPGMGGMRTPSRFVVVAITGVSVLAGYGAQQVIVRIGPRLRPIAIAVLLAGVVADGWAVPIPIVRYPSHGRPEDRAVAEWLAAAPDGVVLHLPIVTTQFQELNYQYATLFHHHPLVNGFTGWDSPLQQLLRHPRGPLYDYARYSATVTMLRSLGIRYVVVHPGDYNVTQLADGELTQTVDGIRGSGQIRQEKRLLDVYAFELTPLSIPTDAPAVLRPISSQSFQLAVSEQPDRAAFLVDGDNDSRWIGQQTGSSAISARFDQPHDVARVELQLAQRSLMDFPRELEIDAEDASGRVRTLYRASPYSEFLAGFLRDRMYPSIRIDLPANDTMTLRVRDVAVYDTWWSVHELRLWRRR